MPGVVAANAPDLQHPLPGSRVPPGAKIHGIDPLASDIVRYVGEPVAVVVAETRRTVADAIETADIDYQPLPPMVDPESAPRGSALVWQDVPGNVAVDVFPGFDDIEGAFQDAPIAVEGRFEFPRAAGASIEPRGAVGVPDENGVVVWDSTQSPYNVRHTIASYFGWEEKDVRVITPCVGGAFGPKGLSYPGEIMLAALAHRHGQAVRWMATRMDDLQTTGQGRGQVHHARLAMRADGTYLASKIGSLSILVPRRQCCGRGRT